MILKKKCGICKIKFNAEELKVHKINNYYTDKKMQILVCKECQDKLLAIYYEKYSQ